MSPLFVVGYVRELISLSLNTATSSRNIYQANWVLVEQKILENKGWRLFASICRIRVQKAPKTHAMVELGKPLFCVKVFLSFQWTMPNIQTHPHPKIRSRRWPTFIPTFSSLFYFIWNITCAKLLKTIAPLTVCHRRPDCYDLPLLAELCITYTSNWPLLFCAYFLSDCETGSSSVQRTILLQGHNCQWIHESARRPLNLSSLLLCTSVVLERHWHRVYWHKNLLSQMLIRRVPAQRPKRMSCVYLYIYTFILMSTYAYKLITNHIHVCTCMGSSNLPTQPVFQHPLLSEQNSANNSQHT